MILHDEWDDDLPGEAPAPPAEAGPRASDTPSPSTGRGRKKSKKRRKQDKAPPELVFATVADFVADFLAPTIRRNLRGKQLTWCPAWWRHPEAVNRLTALWRSWEHLRLDPALGMSTWWLHHADPHLNAVMDPNTGPLSRCNPERHQPHAHPPLPLEKPDPALWLSPAFSAASAGQDSGG